jgi:2-polyprenyl-3-methyl-5-hydroxy-6-metoxy-1,4-benzoquinol methylase
MLPVCYPSLREYELIPKDTTFLAMNQFCQEFMQANPGALDYYSKRWVANPIHNWSRRWEYLYVYQQIEAFACSIEPQSATGLDAGSGLTFFPHFVVSKYPQVNIQCCDNDARLCSDAQNLRSPASPQVGHTTLDISSLNYPQASFDLLYCISVLEHCKHPGDILKGFSHVLKPGGRLILTIDISLDGRSEIPPMLAARLIAMLSQYFTPDENYDPLIRAFDPRTI